MNVMKWLKHEMKANRELLLCVFACVVVFGLMAHAFGFLNLNLNHDYVTEFSMYGVTGWKLTIGRFMMPVVGVIFGEYMAMPWFSGVFALVMVSLSVYLILRMFDLRQRWQVAALSGLMITNLAITALSASFMGDVVSDTFGLLLAVGAAYIWCGMRKKLRFGGLILCILLLTIALGCYQSHLSITVVLIMIKLAEELLNGRTAKEVFREGLRGALPVLIGVILYYVIANVVCMANGLDMASGTTNSLSNVWSQDGSVISRIFYTYIYVFWALFVPAISPVPARANILPLASDTWHIYLVCLVNALILVFMVITLIASIRKSKLKTPSVILLGGILLVMPFMMNVTHFLSGSSHILMQLPFVLYYLLFIVVIARVESSWRWPTVFRRAVFWVAMSMAVVVFVQIEYSNAIYTKKEIESEATLATMTRVLAAIESQDDYRFGETIICPIGTNVRVQGKVPETGIISQVTGAEANWAISYQGVYDAYFRNVLLYPVKVCTVGQAQEIEKTEAFAKMGVFPDSDSVKTVDGMIVVKMSD